MTTERGSFEDQGGVDAIVATREDELIGTGLDDSEPTAGSGYDIPSRTTSGSTSTGSTGSGDRLQDAAGGVVERVAGTAQDKVGTQVDSQLARAGDLLQQLAGAVRQSGEQLRDEQPQIAGFADTAAQQVDRASEYLRRTDFQGLVRETEQFARRQPAVFLGGALALGLVASRFLKASPQGGGRSFGETGGSNPGYGGGYGSSYGAGSRFGRGSESGSYGSAATSYGESTYGSTGSGGYGGGTGYAASGGASTATAGVTGTTGAEHGGV